MRGRRRVKFRLVLQGGPPSSMKTVAMPGQLVPEQVKIDFIDGPDAPRPFVVFQPDMHPVKAELRAMNTVSSQRLRWF